MLKRSLKLAAAAAAITALSITAAAPGWAGDRWDRDGRHDRHGRYDHRDHGRDWRGRGHHRGSYYKSPRIIVKPSFGFRYNWNSGYYGSRYAPHRPFGYAGWRHNYRYGRRHSGFGFYYSDHDAARFLGLTALGLVIFNELSEAQQRAHEDALVRATNARIGDRITWNQGGRSGDVVVTREGHTTDGRPCREFQQQVSIGGQREQAYGTACMQPDGSWQIVNAN